jgi:hypothetical protein
MALRIADKGEIEPQGSAKKLFLDQREFIV